MGQMPWEKEPSSLEGEEMHPAQDGHIFLQWKEEAITKKLPQLSKLLTSPSLTNEIPQEAPSDFCSWRKPVLGCKG